MPIGLRIVSGALSARASMKPGQEISFGSGTGAGIVVPDAGLLPAHFSITGGEQACRVRDLGGGTRLDGKRIREVNARHGSVISASDTSVEIQIDPRAAAPEASAVQRIRWKAAGKRRERLRSYARLLGDQPKPLFAILDAARDPRVLPLVQRAGEDRWSLFPGEHEARLAAYAPYLIRLPPGSPLLGALLEEGFGQSFGVFFVSDRPVERILLGLQYLLIVQDEAGRIRYFRYYDPRVLRVFLPMSAPQQADVFFAAIDGFFVEGERGGSLIWFGRG